MVSGRFQPTYTLRCNEIALFRHLTATVENLTCFRIVAAPGTMSQNAREGVEGDNHPFYMIAADGVAFGEAVKKNMMATGGGERHDLLLCFEGPGEYLIKSDHLGTIQFFGTGPRDQILARIAVTEEDAGGTHHFHVHVNAFQVKEAYSAQMPDHELVGADAPIVQSRIDALKAIDRPNQWRDTMIIPPKGYLGVWSRMYAKQIGKTVLHCHFLAHEETAMIQNFFIKPKGRAGRHAHP